MDIFEFAMEKEKYAEQYYRQLAEKVDHTGLKSILAMLADEEAKHFQTVQQMKASASPSIAETPVLQKAKEVDDASQKKLFQKLAEEENKHLVLVQGLRDFVAKPETYLQKRRVQSFR